MPITATRPPQSYYGFLKAGSGLLLNGEIACQSARYESELDAERWLTATVRANKESLRDVQFAVVHATSKPFEIARGK
jgi:hypothetical protein